MFPLNSTRLRALAIGMFLTTALWPVCSSAASDAEALQKYNVEIVSGGGELPNEILPRDIEHDDSMLHTVTLAKFNACFLKQVLPPRNEDNVDS